MLSNLIILIVTCIKLLAFKQLALSKTVLSWLNNCNASNQQYGGLFHIDGTYNGFGNNSNFQLRMPHNYQYTSFENSQNTESLNNTSSSNRIQPYSTNLKKSDTIAMPNTNQFINFSKQ